MSDVPVVCRICQDITLVDIDLSFETPEDIIDQERDICAVCEESEEEED